MINPQFLDQIYRYFPRKAHEIKLCVKQFQKELQTSELDMSLHGDGLISSVTQNGTTSTPLAGGEALEPNSQIVKDETALSSATPANEGVVPRESFETFADAKTQFKEHFNSLPQLHHFLEKLKFDIIQDDKAFLEFVRAYQNMPQVNGRLKDTLLRIEAKHFEQELDLDERLILKGVTPNKLEKIAAAKKKFIANYELTTSSMIPNINDSVIDDIDGSKFENCFRECLWILLTSQKPSPVEQKATAKTNHLISLKQANAEKMSKNLILGTGKMTTFENNSSANEPKQKNGKEDNRTIMARNSTMNHEPGSTNMNFLQQQQQTQIILPQKRYGHTSTLVGNRLYVFGGAHKRGTGSGTFHNFYECTVKLESQQEDLFKWKRIFGDAPKTRDSHSAVTFMDQILIFGGSQNSKCFNDLYKYNIHTRYWQKLEPIFDQGNLPDKREGHIAVMFDKNKMLIHGGINEQTVCYDDAYVLMGLHDEIDQAQSEIKYDGAGRISNVNELKIRRENYEMLRWIKCTQSGDVPSGRDSHSSTLANNVIYIFGGQDQNENLLDELYKVIVVQGTKKTKINLDDGTFKMFNDISFNLVWSKINVNPSCSNSDTQVPWPIKRSSHSMNIYMDRFLILIGGETSKDPVTGDEVEMPQQDSANVENKAILDVSNNGAENNSVEAVSKVDEESGSDSESSSKSLNDVWVFDIYLNQWKEIKPIVKVQPQFNSKRQRKTFEPRMAHTCNIYHDYLVVFGGYNSSLRSYQNANFNLLSLHGCTDYMLQRPRTLKMIQEESRKINIDMIKMHQVQHKGLPHGKKRKGGEADDASQNQVENIGSDELNQNLNFACENIKNKRGSYNTKTNNYKIQINDFEVDQEFANPASETKNQNLHSGNGNIVNLQMPQQTTSNSACIAGSKLKGKKGMMSKESSQSGPFMAQLQNQYMKENSNASNMGSYKNNQSGQRYNNDYQRLHTVDQGTQANHTDSIQNSLLLDRYKTLKSQQQNKLSFELINQMSNQIKFPIQLIVELLKNQISNYECFFQLNDEKDNTKIVLNLEECKPLCIDVQLLTSECLGASSKKKDDPDALMNILLIKDNGPGINHTNLRQMLTGEINQSQTLFSNKQKQHHEIQKVFKFGALNLSETCLVISRTVQFNKRASSSLQLHPDAVKLEESKTEKEIHIGLLSSKFIKESNSRHLIAPIVSLKVQKKKNVPTPQVSDAESWRSYQLVPITPLPQKFLSLILTYVGIFESVEELMEHILRDAFGINQDSNKFQTGTEIYLCDLKKSYHAYNNDIFLVEKYQHPQSNEKLNMEPQNSQQIEESLISDIQHSIVTQLNYAYIDFPQNIYVKINNQSVQIQNPFESIIKYVLMDENLSIKGQSQCYKFWLIQESKLKQLDEYQQNENSCGKFEGLILYKGDEFIRVDNTSQPYMRKNEISLGKRAFSDMKMGNCDNAKNNERLHGIVMIQKEASKHFGANEFSNFENLPGDLTYDRQNLSNKEFLEQIRNEIYKAYTKSTGGVVVDNTPVKSENMILDSAKKYQKKGSLYDSKVRINLVESGSKQQLTDIVKNEELQQVEQEKQQDKVDVQSNLGNNMKSVVQNFQQQLVANKKKPMPQLLNKTYKPQIQLRNNGVLPLPTAPPNIPNYKMYQMREPPAMHNPYGMHATQQYYQGYQPQMTSIAQRQRMMATQQYRQAQVPGTFMDPISHQAQLGGHTEIPQLLSQEHFDTMSEEEQQNYLNMILANQYQMQQAVSSSGMVQSHIDNSPSTPNETGSQQASAAAHNSTKNKMNGGAALESNLHEKEFDLLEMGPNNANSLALQQFQRVQAQRMGLHSMPHLQHQQPDFGPYANHMNQMTTVPSNNLYPSSAMHFQGAGDPQTDQAQFYFQQQQRYLQQQFSQQNGSMDTDQNQQMEVQNIPKIAGSHSSRERQPKNNKQQNRAQNITTNATSN